MRATLGVSLLLVLLATGTLPAQETDFSKPIIDKAIESIGAEKTVAAMNGFTCDAEGKTVGLEAQAAFHVLFSFQGLGKLRADVDLSVNGGARASFGLFAADGKAWVQSPQQNKVNDLPKEIWDVIHGDLTAVRLAQRPTLLRDRQAFPSSPLGEFEENGKKLVALRVEPKGAPGVELYYDGETHLPTKVAVRVTEQGGAEVEHVWRLSGYKDFGGLKHFTTVRFERDGTEFLQLELSNVQFSESLNEATFQRP